jgi:vacuolar-type H+-ATPase subunit E/Vma4
MSAASSLSAFCWPASKLGEAIEELSVKTRLLDKRPSMIDDALSLQGPEALEGDREALDQWIEAAAEWIGVEAEPLNFSYSEVEAMLRRSGPAIIRVPALGDSEFLAVARTKDFMTSKRARFARRSAGSSKPHCLRG